MSEANEEEEISFLHSSREEPGETTEKKKCCRSLRQFPLPVFLIIGNEFCERFSFYGMRAILVIYFIVEHNFTESHSILVFHAFVSIAYVAPLFGSVAADNFFGKYFVIVAVSVVYVVGHIFLTIGLWRSKAENVDVVQSGDVFRLRPRHGQRSPDVIRLQRTADHRAGHRRD